jgi:hypothetical protein
MLLRRLRFREEAAHTFLHCSLCRLGARAGPKSLLLSKGELCSA